MLVAASSAMEKRRRTVTDVSMLETTTMMPRTQAVDVRRSHTTSKRSKRRICSFRQSRLTVWRRYAASLGFGNIGAFGQNALAMEAASSATMPGAWLPLRLE